MSETILLFNFFYFGNNGLQGILCLNFWAAMAGRIEPGRRRTLQEEQWKRDAVRIEDESDKEQEEDVMPASPDVKFQPIGQA